MFHATTDQVSSLESDPGCAQAGCLSGASAPRANVPALPFTLKVVA